MINLSPAPFKIGGFGAVTDTHDRPNAKPTGTAAMSNVASQNDLNKVNNNRTIALVAVAILTFFVIVKK